MTDRAPGSQGLFYTEKKSLLEKTKLRSGPQGDILFSGFRKCLKGYRRS